MKANTALGEALRKSGYDANSWRVLQQMPLTQETENFAVTSYARSFSAALDEFEVELRAHL